jgi:hypothetical protein
LCFHIRTGGGKLMAFKMTSSVKIGSFKPVKPSSLKWSRKVDDFSDTATVKLPAITKLKKNGDTYELVQTGLQITEGMPIEFSCGYDGKNDLRFKGFVRRINFTVPLELECEGYSYQLRKKIDFSCSHQSITLKKLLEELTQGTDIKLSEAIPDVPLQNIRFKNVKGTDVLEYLKDKCLLTSHFDFEELYCGLKMTDIKKKVLFRLDWNVIKSNELKFEANKELAKVNIKIEKREKTGHKKKGATDVKDGSVKTLQVRHITDEASLKAIADQKRSELVHQGYEGKITAFLIPYVEPSMAAKIIDKTYPERSGTYFIESVEGELSTSGGRQKIGIGVTLNG